VRRTALAVGAAVLAVQVALVGDEHPGPTRYVAWAPNDYVVQYRSEATPRGIWYFPGRARTGDVAVIAWPVLGPQPEGTSPGPAAVSPTARGSI
jgi:hypothetical protein